ncbi:MAG: hypothetical protein ACKVZH_21060 [Blastocatellia bacterium]
MATKTHKSLQPYPRRQPDGYLADDFLFPTPEPLQQEQLNGAIVRSFERSLKNKRGEVVRLPQTPKELVKLCLTHLRERSDPILSPSFLAQCPVEEIFELDAIAHEMQRHRMRIGLFYQYLVIELMRHRYPSATDGEREGDVKVDIETPHYDKGLRLFMSVKKSADTVGGQDVSGMIRRLESLAVADQGLTRPYLCIACVATPPRGVIQSYELSREMKRNRDGHPYSPNCEVWLPGFVFPFISGLSPMVIYKAALTKVTEFLPFHSLSQREECGLLLKAELHKLGLINGATQKLELDAFQQFVSQTSERKGARKK